MTPRGAYIAAASGFVEPVCDFVDPRSLGPPRCWTCGKRIELAPDVHDPREPWPASRTIYYCSMECAD